MGHLLEIDSIRKSFGKKDILSDISLRIETGEIIGIFGRNGSGKTTLFEIISGIQKGNQQFLRMDGRVLKDSFDFSNKIHLLPQAHFLPNQLKIKTIIPLLCNQEQTEILNINPIISKFLSSKPNEISGGERRYTEIMLLLHSDCKSLLLDEPFTALSPKLTDLITSEIIKAKPEKGILITDHHYETVWNIANKKLLLKDGHLQILKQFEELKFQRYLH